MRHPRPGPDGFPGPRNPAVHYVLPAGSAPRSLPSEGRPIRHGHTRCAIPEFDHNSIPHHCGVESPKVLAVALDHSRMQSTIGFHAGARQMRLVFRMPVFIQKSEMRAEAMVTEYFRADPPHIFLASRFRCSRRQFAKHLPAPIFDYPFRCLQGGGQHAAHTPPRGCGRAIHHSRRGPRADARSLLVGDDAAP